MTVTYHEFTGETYNILNAYSGSIRGYWEDENGNRWTTNIANTEEKAIRYSNTLTNCRNCVNCVDCVDCYRCYEIADCVNCVDCYICGHLKNCKGCGGCGKCVDCRDCIDCYASTDLVGCRGGKSVELDYKVEVLEDNSFTFDGVKYTAIDYGIPTFAVVFAPEGCEEDVQTLVKEFYLSDKDEPNAEGWQQLYKPVYPRMRDILDNDEDDAVKSMKPLGAYNMIDGRVARGIKPQFDATKRQQEPAEVVELLVRLQTENI